MMPPCVRQVSEDPVTAPNTSRRGRFSLCALAARCKRPQFQVRDDDFRESCNFQGGEKNGHLVSSRPAVDFDSIEHNLTTVEVTSV